MAEPIQELAFIVEIAGIMTFDPTPYLIGPGLLHWLIVFGSFLFIALGVAFLTSLGLNGLTGPVVFLQHLSDGVRDTMQLSARRIWAITVLTIRESVRRKAPLVLVIFGLLIMFAGWFVSDTNARPELQVEVHVSFVLTAITWLVLPVVLLLSCWGLPADIKARSLHTVVTKPARKNEIYLGRVFGFAIVGTVILLLMGGVGYVWILRQVPEEAQSKLIARVPVYGDLQFFNREGLPDEQGINVGDAWEYRGYIEGATRSMATWDFEGLRPAHTAEEDTLILESHFEAFRTHKGEMGQELLAQFTLVNEETGLRVPLTPFSNKEFGDNLHYISQNVTYIDPETNAQHSAELFGDIIQNGKLKVEVRCLDAGQYIGMARPDLFIRTPDRPFAVSYFKAVFGTWLMTALVVVLGVTASCFVKGPVATLLTFTLIVVGQGARNIMEQIVTGQLEGGGPFEAWVRLIRHLNPQVELPPGFTTDLIKSADAVMINMLWLMQHVIPDFQYFRMTPYVAKGFDVAWSTALLPAVAVTLAYLLPCLFIGYYSLKLRELEAK